MALETQQSCQIFSAILSVTTFLDRTSIDGSKTPIWGGGGGILMLSLLTGDAGGVRGLIDKFPLGGLVVVKLAVTN